MAAMFHLLKHFSSSPLPEEDIIAGISGYHEGTVAWVEQASFVGIGGIEDGDFVLGHILYDSAFNPTLTNDKGFQHIRLRNTVQGEHGILWKVWDSGASDLTVTFSKSVRVAFAVVKASEWEFKTIIDSYSGADRDVEIDLSGGLPASGLLVLCFAGFGSNCYMDTLPNISGEISYIADGIYPEARYFGLYKISYIEESKADIGFRDEAYDGQERSLMDCMVFARAK